MLISVTDEVMGPPPPPPPLCRKLNRSSHPILSQSHSAPVVVINSSSREGTTTTTTQSRIRILHLRRPPSHKSYGFHLRGGREHGTGFFISHVEPRSEAHSQGLRTGDQVIRVNNLNVSRALHKEVAALVQAGTEVVLEVKSAGLVPVKNNAGDPLSWILVENGGDDCSDSGSPGPPTTEYQPDFSKLNPGNAKRTSKNSSSNYGSPVQIILGGAGKYTIGCSICKGPSEKPGIYVQRVRERGMAESAGLRPGDQILCCNGVSFYNIEFQKAVQAMKASSCLRLEVLRGAGLELVMGESSGYNSSASSETGGEETYPSSDTDTRDAYSHTLASSLSNKLNRVRDRVQLDSSRDWKEIEAEWADAEVSEKRDQLKVNTYSTLSRQSYAGGMSKSFLNLTINEDDQSPSSSCSHYQELNYSRPPATMIKRSTLTKPKSMIDLRDGSSYKIAMQTVKDAHVSKIVIASAPKNELNALRRLDELSTGPKTSTLLSMKSMATNHNKNCSISSTSSEEYSNHEHLRTHARTLHSTLKENRPLHRCRSVPQDCNVASSEDSDSLSSYPSSSICISNSDSGRYTSKIIIRNNPPDPPPRDDATKLTRQQQRKLRRNQPKALPPGDQWPHSHLESPPDSPCNSSSGCSSRGREGPMTLQSTTCTHLLRHKSLGSLSASSDEFNSWDDRNPIHLRNSTTNVTLPTIPSPPSMPPTGGGNIPPPPPPPPPLLNLSSLQSQIISRQQEITGTAGKLRSPSERPLERKLAPPDPKKMQHEQLMDEFKKAHARMLAKRQSNVPQENEEAANTQL